MIVELLKQSGRWRIYSPKQEIGHNRAWYDVSINDLFCNIKVSKCTANDNAQAKKAIYYLLTGDREAERVPEQHSDFFRMMRENEDPDEDRDYYYLVINKTDTSDIFVANLKGIAVCNSTPNNMPFQVNWRQNRKLVERTWEEARQFLLGVWAELIKKLVKLRIDGMQQHYPEFFSSTTMHQPDIQ